MIWCQFFTLIDICAVHTKFGSELSNKELEMQYTTLPKTDVKVSRICLGTMTWGRQNTEAEGHEQMDYALGEGVNFWDTAEMYAVPPTPETQGKTEEIIGTWFAKTGKRDQVVLATKIAGNGVKWIRDGRQIDRQSVEQAVEGSLKRLQTDYIDLYQLHWPNRGSYHFQNFWGFNPYDKDGREKVRDNMLEVLQALGEQVKAGKIRHIGLSNESVWGTMQYLELAREHGLPEVVTAQNEYSLLRRQYDTDHAEMNYYEQVGLLAWSPLATGILSGKYQGGKMPEGTRGAILGAGFSRLTDQAQAATEGYMQVAEKHGLDVNQMALAFTLSKPFTTATIIGATSMEQLKTNIGAWDVKLSEAVLNDIQAVYQQYPIPF